MTPGQKTTEFLSMVAYVVGVVAFAVADKLPAKWAAIASSVSVGAYAISRGLTKMHAPKPTG